MSDKPTTAETNAYYEQNIAGIQKQVNEAGAQAGAAKDALDSAMENNEANPNTGLGTGVAKDANGLAIGTYDWDKQAEHMAKISYNSDVLTEKSKATAAKQELTANQQQGQAQYDMAAYSAQQSAEKAGWTGGYILDSNRQVEFLKESIKANLYSQEELQKYGYDTALAAARASYDLKKSELAIQYYNTAVENAFRMAEYTGKFISPEASFHIAQLGTAEKIKNDKDSSQEDIEKAEAIIASTESWFKTNKISKEGMYCISQLVDHYTALQGAYTNLQNALTAANEEAREYKLQLISTQETADAKNETSIDTGLFSYVDEYGELKTVSANYAVALKEGTRPEELSESDKAIYNSNLNKFLNDKIVIPEVKDKLSTLNFTSKPDAINAVNAFIAESLADISDANGDSLTINTFNVTVKVNGVDTQIEVVGGDTVTTYKNLPPEKKSFLTHRDISSNEAISTKPASSRFTDSDHLIGLNQLKEGENFHIRNQKARGDTDADGTAISDNWELELWSSLTADQAKEEGLDTENITATGIYYVNNTNKYIDANTSNEKHAIVGATEAELKDAQKLGTAYYVEYDASTKKITSIHVIGAQQTGLANSFDGNSFQKNYVTFIKALAAEQNA